MKIEGKIMCFDSNLEQSKEIKMLKSKQMQQAICRLSAELKAVKDDLSKYDERILYAQSCYDDLDESQPILELEARVDGLNYDISDSDSVTNSNSDRIDKLERMITELMAYFELEWTEDEVEVG